MIRWRPLVWLVGLVLASVVFASLILPRCTALRTEDLIGPWQDVSGRPLPDGSQRPDFPLVIQTARGHAHCNARNVIFLLLSWPPGTVHSGPLTGTERQYVRDPDGRYAGLVLDPYDGSVSLPEAAVPTGFHRLGNTLYVDPDGAAYVRRPSGVVERWARAIPPIVCA